MSTFNPDAFMNTAISEANDTKIVPIPEGDHIAAVKEIKGRVAKDRPILDVIWLVDSDEAKQATGMETPQIKQSIFLDFTETGALDMSKGKNVQLGKLRAALGQNVSGKPWMPGHLIGGVAKIKITHRVDGEDIFADVKTVTALSNGH